MLFTCSLVPFFHAGWHSCENNAFSMEVFQWRCILKVPTPCCSPCYLFPYSTYSGIGGYKRGCKLKMNQLLSSMPTVNIQKGALDGPARVAWARQTAAVRERQQALLRKKTPHRALCSSFSKPSSSSEAKDSGWSSHESSSSWKVEAPSSSSSSPEQPSALPGLSRLGEEFLRRGFCSLPWVDVATAPPVQPLLMLGAGTYGKVDLVDWGGEVLVRKKFRFSNSLLEAYALTMLQGAGGTPILRGVIKKPLTVFMTYCGNLTLKSFLKSSPKSEQVVQVLLQLSMKLGELHAKGLVHLDLKGDNVMVQHKGGGNLQVHIIDVGLAALPGQCIPFKQGAEDRADWMCPQVKRRGPVTFAADVYSLGRLITKAEDLLQGHPAAHVLDMLADKALAEDPTHRPALTAITAILRAHAHVAPSTLDFTEC